MPTSTDLSISPYFSSFDPEKDFYRILFRPGVAVQVRELNDLQAMFQRQIELFGDNIARPGTIIDGCNFTFYPNYNYVKLVDADVSGVPIDVSLFENLFVKNSSNLVGYVIDSRDGFETTSPSLKTIYVNYLNSGETQTDTAFSPSDVLTVFDANNAVFQVNITNGGLGFSNTDSVIFSPALVVNMLTGTFSVGQYILQPDTGANVQIVTIDTTTLATQGQVILYVSPRSSDLSSNTSNSTIWTVEPEHDIINTGSTASATVLRVVGSGARATVLTNSIGKIRELTMTSRGVGYTYAPTVKVRSPGNSPGLAAIDIASQNYLTQVAVASSGDAAGNGYAFGVSNGVIYQKGFFERVAAQRIIVEPYNNTPNAVAVGFTTVEDIIDSNIDPTLLDNALGINDDNAPGANRLKLTPELLVVNVETARANSNFFTLVEWNDGNPYKQNRTTAYSKINDEMSKRTYDVAGDFVLDPFLVTTASVSNTELMGQYYAAITDSGSGYISGGRVKTNYNYRIDVPKGLDTQISNNHKVSLNYDSYLRVNQVGGIFQFSTGDTVQFYDAYKTYLSNVSLVVAGNTTPQGNLIGTARIRSMLLEGGTAGDPTAIYRLYLFNVAMANGSNFGKVRSVYYDGSSYKGIADAILTFDPTTQANVAKIQSVQNDTMIFKTGLESIKNSNNSTYIYRTISQTTVVANTGILSKSIAANPDEFFPYSGALTNAQMQELYVVPIGNNLIQYTDLTGTISCNTTSPNLVGTTTTFLSDFVAGDYVYLYPNNVAYDIKKVITVVNNTLMVMDSNTTFANTTNNFKHVYPKNLPVPFGPRDGLSANVDINGNILTLDWGMTFDSATSIPVALGYNVLKQDTTSASKTVNRNQLVKIRCANSVANTIGPWCLGVADVFRLKNVYIGTSTVNTASINITDEFYIDHNQTADYYDLSYLYRKPKSPIILTSSDYLLVEFDYFISTSASYHDPVSYRHTSNAAQIAEIDSTVLEDLTSDAATYEIPEMYTYKGGYFDLLNCIDFRPAATNTAGPTTSYLTAPVNPAYALSFGNTADPVNDLKFPLPDSLFESDIEQYLGRTDTIILGQDTVISVLRGISQADPRKRQATNLPQSVMKLQTIHVAPYPNIPLNLSTEEAEVISTGVFNERDIFTRIKNHTLTRDIDITNVTRTQPKRQTAAQIGNLERRIETLEKYVSLSILETSITSKIIPSSIDGSLNRFKFGFMADDFSTAIYSDRGNPQYAASIEPVSSTTPTLYAGDTTLANALPSLATNLLVPPSFRWRLQHAPGQISATYIDQVLISQDTATANVVITNPNTTPNSVIVSNTAQINAFWYQQGSFFSQYITSWGQVAGRFSTHGAGVGVLLHRTWELQMSSTSGNVVIYFATKAPAPPPEQPVVNYDPKIIVFQNNVPLVNSSISTAISHDEALALVSDPYTRQFFDLYFHGNVTELQNNFSLLSSNGDFAGAGKFSFQHDASKGSNYTIVFSLRSTADSLEWYDIVMEYPVDTSISSALFGPPGTTTSPTTYWGNMDTFVSSETIKITCTGLKPSTQHFFYLDGVADTENVRQWGKNYLEPMVSSDEGKLVVQYFLSETWQNKIANAKKIPVFSNTAITGGSGTHTTEYDTEDLIASGEVAADGLLRDYGPYLPIAANPYEGTSFVPSYALFVLSAPGSIAYEEVPLILPNKLIF